MMSPNESKQLTERFSRISFGTVSRFLISAIDRLLNTVKVWVAVAAGILLIALQISWLREPLTKIGIERDTGLETSVVLVLLVTILLELRELARMTEQTTAGEQYYPDPHEMYQALLAQAASISKVDERRMDVLGLTLYSAWPYISFWLQRPEIAGWTIRLATLAKDADVITKPIPVDWPAESAANVGAIKIFAESLVADNKHHKLELFEYNFTPAIHGFRLGNGDIYISTLLWQEDGKLGKAGFSYDYIPATELGSRAMAQREIFDNWFSRAVVS
jgi:hypothetical protein